MKKEGYFLIGGIVGINVAIIILFAFNPIADAFSFFVRLCALLGLAAMFISAMLTPFQKELYQMFKKPFIKVHHASTITGLVLITLHPVIFAIDQGISNSSVRDAFIVFLPDFSSNFDFWRLAGRPALILIYIALVGALLRKALKSGWRWIHALNYIALNWGVVHGIIIGSDFWDFQLTPIPWNRLITTILFLLMILLTYIAFTLKRVDQYKRWKKKKEREKKKQAEQETTKEDAEEETTITEEVAES